MAKEENSTSHKASQDKRKLDIEDIKDPEGEEPARSDGHSRQNENVGLAGGDLDIEEVVSEEAEKSKMPDEIEESVAETESEEIPEQEIPNKGTENTEKGNPSTNAQDDDKSSEEEKQPEADKDVLEEAVSKSSTENIEKKTIIEETVKKKKVGKKRWKTVLMILISVLVTAALVLGGVYWYMSTQNKEEPKKEEPKQEETKKEDTATTTEKVVYVSPTEGLRLRKEPNPNAEILATMPQGTKLIPLETQGDWIKAEYQDKTGWCLSTYTSAENPLVYKDTKYGFQITFPEAWAGYKFFEKNIDGAIVLYLGLPTTQTGWTGTGVDAGYSSMFAIDVYTKAQWATIGAEEGPKPTKLGEKGDRVFAWSQAQAAPSDLEKRFTEIRSVIDTFKVI